METIKYLKQNGIEKLKQELFIKVRDYPEHKLLVLNYDQLNSPTLHPIVKECRSLILDYDFNVVSRSFDRFFNLNEKPCSTFEFENNMKLYEKIDGSIINIYHYNGKWNTGTKSSAFGEFSSSKIRDISFHDNVLETINLTEDEFQHKFNNLNKNLTFICEFSSLDNQVIKEYPNAKLSLLSVRNNSTGLYLNEHDFNIISKSLNFSLPIEYKINSIDDIYQNLNNLNGFDEGFVLFQNGCPIAKIKTLTYVTVSLIKGEQGGTNDNLKKIIIAGEQSEFLTYFPQYSEKINELTNNFNMAYNNLIQTWNSIKNIENQKEFALAIKNPKFSGILFKARKTNVNNIKEYFDKLDTKIKLQIF